MKNLSKILTKSIYRILAIIVAFVIIYLLHGIFTTKESDTRSFLMYVFVLIIIVTELVYPSLMKQYKREIDSLNNQKAGE